MNYYDDTIYALSSGSLPAGVAVMRVSGGCVSRILSAMVSVEVVPRVASLRILRNGDGLVLDKALVLYFPGPNSFTGEDCLEFQLHGGKAVVASVTNALGQFDSVRPAEAGEFSRRAFENGKLDLVEIEGLADLIHAETEMQRRMAIAFSGGGVSKVYRDWMERITRNRALIEAELDFADEGDVPGSVSDQVWADIAALDEEMKLAQNAPICEIVRDGFKVAIVGAPNVGKSSLLNYLAKRDVAIVSKVAGTTRDVIQVDLDVSGFKVSFYDTAGIRETEDEIELEGIRRAQSVAADSDLILRLCDMSQESADGQFELTITGGLRIGTKLDRVSDPSLMSDFDVCISVEDGRGIDSLVKRICAILEQRLFAINESVLVRDRHRDYIDSATEQLLFSIEAHGVPLELRAESLRSASTALGRIVGQVSADDLLGKIFSEFCIGK